MTDIKSKVETAQKYLEDVFGLKVRVNIRPNRRPSSDPFAEPGLYNTQIEFEMYLPGPLQVAEEEAARAREAAAAAPAPSPGA